MTRFIFPFVVLFLGMLACTPTHNPPNNSSKTITLEVSGNQVLLLDNKEVHVDYLSSVLAGLNAEFDISARLTISQDAQMSTVHDVQKTLYSHAVKVTQDGE
jgi:biopolymer transport protein ExbD